MMSDRWVVMTRTHVCYVFIRAKGFYVGKIPIERFILEFAVESLQGLTQNLFSALKFGEVDLYTLMTQAVEIVYSCSPSDMALFHARYKRLISITPAGEKLPLLFTKGVIKTFLMIAHMAPFVPPSEGTLPANIQGLKKELNVSDIKPLKPPQETADNNKDSDDSDDDNDSDERSFTL